MCAEVIKRTGINNLRSHQASRPDASCEDSSRGREEKAAYRLSGRTD